MRTAFAFIAFCALAGCDLVGCHHSLKKHLEDKTGPKIRLVKDSDSSFHFQRDAPLEEERVVLAEITRELDMRNEPHVIIRKDGLILTFRDDWAVIHNNDGSTYVIDRSTIIMADVTGVNFAPPGSVLFKPRVIHEENGSKNVVIDGQSFPVVQD